MKFIMSYWVEDELQVNYRKFRGCKHTLHYANLNCVCYDAAFQNQHVSVDQFSSFSKPWSVSSYFDVSRKQRAPRVTWRAPWPLLANTSLQIKA